MLEMKSLEELRQVREKIRNLPVRDEYLEYVKNINLWTEGSLRLELLDKITAADAVEADRLRDEVIAQEDQLSRQFRTLAGAVKSEFANALMDLGVPQRKIYKANGDMYAKYLNVCQDLIGVYPHRRSYIKLISFIYNRETYRSSGSNWVTHLASAQRELARLRSSDERHIRLMNKAREVLDTDSDDPAIIKLAEDFLKAKALEEVEDTTIDVQHADGDDCEWDVGDRRCHCGHNRYYAETEGTLLGGYYVYGQWH